ncbi:flagellar basal body-associated protein FliL [Halobacteriovorax sp. HLS]|uniref:flagellar basal body-associated FliL family protein n=1 Tax=Halobacteriovorax sp. HLS TaxID=2234000 RepID=UPI000FD8C10A|nr:flagellar basal body-associated FliL family protein [Halobacteriovorax sp. HLS]
MADGDANDSGKSNPGGAKNPLLTVVMLLQFILTGAIAFYQYQMHVKMSSNQTTMDIIKSDLKNKAEGIDESSETGEAREEDGVLFPLDNFTANLAQGDGPRRFVRLNAVLKFNKESSEEEFKARKPQIRDTIISILNSKRAEDLLKTEGKNYLKEEVKAAINSFLVDGKVIDVFYVSFQIN